MKYYIIAGEASGDLHGSHLIRAIVERDTQAEIRCWGGDLMKKAGGKLIKHYRELAFMGWEAIMHLRTILKNLRFCKEDITQFNPDVIIYIDYPGFNLRIAKWAKKKNFRNHYYIGPKVWAWRESRTRDLKENLDELYVIFPFEKKFYEERHHFPVHFVGNPLMDHIPTHTKKKNFIETHQLEGDCPIIALLPGSRKQEIKKILPVFLDVTKRFENYQFVVAAAPGLALNWYNRFLEKSTIKIVQNCTYDLLQHSVAAIVASGTATLETALFRVPLIVCYRTDFFTYHIGKRLISIKWISLVNIILNQNAVTELIQEDCNVNAIEKELRFILSPPGKAGVLRSYDALFEQLGDPGANARTADLILKSIANQ